MYTRMSIALWTAVQKRNVELYSAHSRGVLSLRQTAEVRPFTNLSN
jgi:hypothetical protein